MKYKPAKFGGLKGHLDLRYKSIFGKKTLLKLPKPKSFRR